MATDSHLASLGRLVESGHRELSKSFPKMEPLGATLFLGRSFADEHLGGIMMLGLNPGGSGKHCVSTKLLDDNPLLDKRPGEQGVQYWVRARQLFNSSPSLRAHMERATFSFCIPYRSPSWSLPAVQRFAMIQHSGPVVDALLLRCRPRFVIVAGKAALGLLINDERLVKRKQRGSLMHYQAFGDEPNACEVVDVEGCYSDMRIIRVPHFSMRGLRHSELPRLGRYLLDVLENRARLGSPVRR